MQTIKIKATFKGSDNNEHGYVKNVQYTLWFCLTENGKCDVVPTGDLPIEPHSYPNLVKFLETWSSMTLLTK